MRALAAKLEQICRVTGRAVAWLCLAMVIVTGIVVVDRYVFNSGSIRLQESVTFMHAVVFMLAAGYTLAAGDHVRVDVFYGSMSARGRALVDLLGSLLLLFPFCLFILWSSWDFVSVSWSIREASQEAGGLPYPFLPLMKSCIPLTMILLMLQGCSMILTSIATLAEASGDPSGVN
ncbi:MAG: TRAP transporter small permease subunit [Gammaproteobacteria bacterium]|nr:TRAP transporter small permease subunit [Gammaproteobacteria bacterium]NND53770.1 TRAP transporter small permease subunit [Gammaproteobacteria bacterium]